VAREHPLVTAVRGAGGAFVCDTGPAVYRLESSGPATAVAVVDALFDEVEAGSLGCFVPSVCAAELLVRPYRFGPAAVTVVDAFLRGPSIAVVPTSLGAAHGAARLVARRVVTRLADALVAATAADVGVPLVTSDRRLARSGATEAFLVADFA
jgi:predicted nucleic acid-binding protein